MHKSLNMIDSKECETKLIISGQEIAIDDNIVEKDDAEKLLYILNNIGIQGISEHSVMNYTYLRIGVPSNDKVRLLKVTVSDKETRDRICEESKKIKGLSEQWKIIYINKDTHPVYLKENQRLRKKMRNLKKTPGYHHETGRVKIVKGMLQVDGRTVDRNLFSV